MRRSARLGQVLAVVSLVTSVNIRVATAEVRESLRKADELFGANQLARAAREYDRAIAEAPWDVPAAAYGKRAAIFIIGKQYQAALAFLDRHARGRNAAAPEVLEQKALALWGLGRRTEAVTAAEAVVGLRPELFSSQRLLGDHHAARQPRRAIRAYEAYFAHRPARLAGQDVLPRARLGYAYLATGALARGEAQFQLLLRDHVGQRQARWNALNGLCAVQTAHGRFDRAIVTCEQLAAEAGTAVRDPALLYNLGRAYLGRRRVRDARRVAEMYQEQRPDDPRGALLSGDCHALDGAWSAAIRSYLAASERDPGPALARLIAGRLGIAYRRAGKLREAAAELERATTGAADPELAIELARTHAALGAHARVLEVVARLLAAPPAGRRGAVVRTLAAQAHYQLGQLDEAIAQAREARKLDPRNAESRQLLVAALNRRAVADYVAGRLEPAQALLAQALGQDEREPTTRQNLAVLALARGSCGDVAQHLQVLRDIPSRAFLFHRLSAQAAMCGSEPSLPAALAHFAQADAELERRERSAARELQRGELHAQWGHALLASDPAEAVSRLQLAVRLLPERGRMAGLAARWLALAHLRRGLALADKGDFGDAARALAQARRGEAHLEPAELDTLTLALAIAQLESGARQGPSGAVVELAARGTVLRPPFEQIGGRILELYARYRTGKLQSCSQAATGFEPFARSREPAVRELGRRLGTAAWLCVAARAHDSGQLAVARRALDAAQRLAADPASRQAIAHNRAVLDMAGGDSRTLSATFNRLLDSTPEALVNLGILYERDGKNRDAYRAWTAARSRGIKSRDLESWITAKERFLGF